MGGGGGGGRPQAIDVGTGGGGGYIIAGFAGIDWTFIGVCEYEGCIGIDCDFIVVVEVDVDDDADGDDCEGKYCSRFKCR